MTNWIKVHNSMPQHPKLLRAGDRAAWLQVCGLCYANEHLTDGFIPRHALPVVAPGVRGAEKLARLLVDVGMWDEVDDGWRIHDYTDHQRSAEEVRERRSKDAARKAVARSTPSPRGLPTGLRGESARIEKKRGEKTKDTSSDADRAGKEIEKATDDDRANCRLFAELVRQRNPKAKIPESGTPAHAGWYRDMRLLRDRDGNAADEITTVIRWIFTDASRDATFWGTTVAAPSGLREHYPQIWAKMTAAASSVAPTVESSAEFLARRKAAA